MWKHGATAILCSFETSMGIRKKNFSVVFIKSYKFGNEHRSIYNNPFHFTVSSER
jgi:hypothetical protein